MSVNICSAEALKAPNATVLRLSGIRDVQGVHLNAQLHQLHLNELQLRRPPIKKLVRET